MPSDATTKPTSRPSTTQPGGEAALEAHVAELVAKFKATLQTNQELRDNFENHRVAIGTRFETFHAELAKYSKENPDDKSMRKFKPTDLMRSAETDYEKTYDVLADSIKKAGVATDKDDIERLILKLTTRTIIIPAPAKEAQPASDVQRGKQSRLDKAMEQFTGELARDMIQHKPMETGDNPAYALAVKGLINKNKNTVS